MRVRSFEVGFVGCLFLKFMRACHASKVRFPSVSRSVDVLCCFGSRDLSCCSLWRWLHLQAVSKSELQVTSTARASVFIIEGYLT